MHLISILLNKTNFGKSLIEQGISYEVRLFSQSYLIYSEIPNRQIKSNFQETRILKIQRKEMSNEKFKEYTKYEYFGFKPE